MIYINKSNNISNVSSNILYVSKIFISIYIVGYIYFIINKKTNNKLYNNRFIEKYYHYCSKENINLNNEYISNKFTLSFNMKFIISKLLLKGIKYIKSLKNILYIIINKTMDKIHLILTKDLCFIIFLHLYLL